jgi:hypothetical protein
LSAYSSVSHSTIWKFEVAGKEPLNSWFIEALQRALEEKGIEFVDGDEPGVRLRKDRPI